MEIRLKGIEQATAQIVAQQQALLRRVNQEAREGMTEAVQLFRQRIVEAMYAAGVQRRSGGTEEAILTGNGKPIFYGSDESSRLTGVVTTVKANQAGNDPRMPMGAWLGAGTVHGAIVGKLMVFVGPDGNPVFTRKARGFQTAPKPFLDPATDEFQPTFQEIMQRHMSAAAASE